MTSRGGVLPEQPAFIHEGGQPEIIVGGAVIPKDLVWLFIKTCSICGYNTFSLDTHVALCHPRDI